MWKNEGKQRQVLWTPFSNLFSVTSLFLTVLKGHRSLRDELLVVLYNVTSSLLTFPDLRSRRSSHLNGTSLLVRSLFLVYVYLNSSHFLFGLVRVFPCHEGSPIRRFIPVTSSSPRSLWTVHLLPVDGTPPALYLVEVSVVVGDTFPSYPNNTGDKSLFFENYKRTL